MKPYIELGITILKETTNGWSFVECLHFTVER